MHLIAIETDNNSDCHTAFEPLIIVCSTDATLQNMHSNYIFKIYWRMQNGFKYFKIILLQIEIKRDVHKGCSSEVGLGIVHSRNINILAMKEIY